MRRTQGYLKLIAFGSENDVVLTGQSKAGRLFGGTANTAAFRGGVILDGVDGDSFSGGTKTDCLVGDDAKDMLPGDAMNDGTYEVEKRVA